MAIDALTIGRRGVLASIGCGAALSLLGVAPARAGTPRLYLSGYATRTAPTAYGVAGLHEDGEVLFTLPLPGRAHAVLPRPTVAREAVAVARRPGYWLVPIDIAAGTAAAPIRVPEGRVFAGHGDFDAAGRFLYTAEENLENEVGAIGVYDASAGYRRVAELPTHGIGPHELVAVEGGRVLVIGNGGIITNPDTGRAKLNVESMDASITWVEAATGALLDKVRLPAEHANLGVRHLAVLSDDTVAFGCQDERPTGEVQPLVGIHRRGEPVRLFDAPEEAWDGFDGYIGAMATDGRLIAASSPRGGNVGVWNAADGRWLGLFPLPDGCGIAAADGGGFLASSGFGTLETLGPDGVRPHPTEPLRWDNHITPVPA